jgi:hypothetical protein
MRWRTARGFHGSPLGVASSTYFSRRQESIDRDTMLCDISISANICLRSSLSGMLWRRCLMKRTALQKVLKAEREVSPFLIFFVFLSIHQFQGMSGPKLNYWIEFEFHVMSINTAKLRSFVSFMNVDRTVHVTNILNVNLSFYRRSNFYCRVDLYSTSCMIWRAENNTFKQRGW